MEKKLQIASGIQIAYKVWGNEKASKKILAVHGWIDNAATWDKLAPLIVEGTKEGEEERVEFVGIDLPGHGHSDHYPFKLMRYRFVDWVSVLFEVIEALGWEEYVLVGHSMGAAVTTIAAGVKPTQVKALINIEGFGPWTEEGEDERAVDLFRHSLTAFSSASLRPPKRYPSLAHAVNRLLLNNPSLLPSSAQCLVQRGVREVRCGAGAGGGEVRCGAGAGGGEVRCGAGAGGGEVRCGGGAGGDEVRCGGDDEGEGGEVYFEFRHDPRLLAPDQSRSLSHSSVPFFLREIKCPVMVVRGKEGMEKVKKYVEERRRWVEDFVEVELPGAHHLHLDLPHLVAPPLSLFLLSSLFAH